MAKTLELRGYLKNGELITSEFTLTLLPIEGTTKYKPVVTGTGTFGSF